ncbi:MAG: DUF3037 domain-containing protein [Thermoleophilia bacterium]
MPRDEPFQYALWRVVPDVERGERINAGVVLFARTLDFLGAMVHLDRERLARLAPGADADAVERYLASLAGVAAGDPAAGPMAALAAHQRFHWLTAPVSTIVQPSEVHTGVCTDPRAALERLFRRLVASPER